MSIASRITSMENNIRNAYHGLDSIGIDTTNTNKNIENISALLEDFYDSLPKVSGTGTSISLSPTRKGRLGNVINGDTEQDGTPTPDNPQEIKSVTGLQKVSVEGKNLYNINNFSISSWDKGGNYTSKVDNTILTTSDFTIYRSKCVEIPNLKSNTNYTFSGKLKSSNTNGGKIIIYGYTGSSIVQIKANDGTLSVGDFSLSFNSGNYTNIGISFNGVGGSTSRETIFENIMIEQGLTATEYEPYQNQEYDINLGTIKLNKIGDYQDYITGTPDNWSIIRQIGSVVLDGSEIWFGPGYELTNSNRFYSSSYLPDSVQNIALSNKFQSVNAVTINNTDSEALCRINEKQIAIRLNKSRATTLADFKTWLSNNNVEVYYVLTTETTEPITNTELISQLNALYYANSYNGTTNISVEGDLPMILDVSALKGEE